MSTIKTEIIKGTIARIFFQDPEKGYASLELETETEGYITACGSIPNAAIGMECEWSGHWKSHPKYGNRLMVMSYKEAIPTGKAGVIAFLVNLEGVGKKKAELLFETFGEDQLFKILDSEDPADHERLLEVKGLTQKTLEKLLESYQEKKAMRELIIFLGELGVSVGYAAKIYKRYQQGAIAKIKADPYLLAETIPAFGFVKADELARGLGISFDSPVRLKAGLFYALRDAANNQGHCYLPYQKLISKTQELLAKTTYSETVGTTLISGSLTDLIAMRKLIFERAGDSVYLPVYYHAECGVAKRVSFLTGAFTPDENHASELDNWIKEFETTNGNDPKGFELTEGQKRAIHKATTHGFSIITGGAGVGKTTICRVLVDYWISKRKRIIGLAPTGKAAQRLKKLTGLATTSTIHRLLRSLENTGKKMVDENGEWLEDDVPPIDKDVFLVDEASMIDVVLANALLQAIPDTAIVVLIGDVNQLPSIGAGDVLNDLIKSGAVPLCRLTQSFRTKETSAINRAATCINKGEVPNLEGIFQGSEKPHTEALWVECRHDEITTAINWLLTDYLPQRDKKPDQIQLLAPQYKGDGGINDLNLLAQGIWNPTMGGKDEVVSTDRFRVGDRVIETVNDYDNNVMNGDIGKITSIDLEEKEVLIDYQGLESGKNRTVKYKTDGLSTLNLAYCISVHKAQGAEFPVVILPLANYGWMLQRRIYYTAATRARELLVFVGEKRSLETAVRTVRDVNRNTRLVERL